MNVKLRSDFNGLPIVFGVLNGTSDGQTDVIESEATANDIAPLLDFATIVTNSVNARWKSTATRKTAIRLFFFLTAIFRKTLNTNNGLCVFKVS